MCIFKGIYEFPKHIYVKIYLSYNRFTAFNCIKTQLCSQKTSLLGFLSFVTRFTRICKWGFLQNLPLPSMVVFYTISPHTDEMRTKIDLNNHLKKKTKDSLITSSVFPLLGLFNLWSYKMFVLLSIFSTRLQLSLYFLCNVYTDEFPQNKNIIIIYKHILYSKQTLCLCVIKQKVYRQNRSSYTFTEQ